MICVTNITEENIAEVISTWTGIPVYKITENENEILNNSNPMIESRSYLPQTNDTASQNYIERYTNYFGKNCLKNTGETSINPSSPFLLQHLCRMQKSKRKILSEKVL